MDPDVYWPIVRESLEFLRRHRLAPSDLMNRKQDHHFSGYGLWMRNTFIHPVGGALHHHSGTNADSVSARFTELIARHGAVDEAAWRRILAAEPEIQLLGRCAGLPGAPRFPECSDDEW